MLSSDLEDNDRDKAALNKVLSTCLEELKLDQMVIVFQLQFRPHSLKRAVEEILCV